MGVRFDDRTTNNLEKYCPNATVIQIDVDPTSISKTVKADIPIVGDAKLTLEQMIAQLDHASLDQNLAALKEWWKEIESWRTKQCLKICLKPKQSEASTSD
ncbi:Acetolactate synthase isozyme 3 large subunit [Providencia rustigianii]|nr:Acetolactate synthase isozyme 3 large subunit [Providencia rustigianii]